MKLILFVPCQRDNKLIPSTECAKCDFNRGFLAGETRAVADCRHPNVMFHPENVPADVRGE